MANDQPLTPATLITHIKQACGAYIGTYTRCDNGAVADAISVGNPPNNIEVTGVEIIIPIYPHTPKSCEGSGYQHSEELWDIYLVDHGNKDNFFLAIRGLMDYFPRKISRNIPQDSITESLPAHLITIKYGRGYQQSL